ncbi:MAG: phosphotransferase [Chloroflexi bacterium]|nr:phosphotransferase [Chloroflexota bacterium]
MTLQNDHLLKLFRQHVPDFAFERAEELQSPGQFNIVLVIDAQWIFRFPKSAAAAADLARELVILPRLHGRLPLPIPQPRYHARDAESGGLLFKGYPLLPGQPLLRERFAQQKDDDAEFEDGMRDYVKC